MSAGVRVSVPATSANIGPGFDAFGLALGLRNTFHAEPAAEWSVEVLGEGADTLSRGADNPVAAAASRLFAEAGHPGAARIVCENEIPPGEGLGSSAAAIVGGLLIGNALAGARVPFEEIFVLATAIEGHPDNVAAALFGGFTVCWEDEGARYLRIEMARGIAAIVIRADWGLATPESRSLLPAAVPHADAAFNAGRAGLLTLGLAHGDDRAIEAGLADRIHEQYRSVAVPDLEPVRAALVDAGAVGAVLSGAGPTVIGFVSGSDGDDAYARAIEVAAAAAAPVARLGHRRAPLALAVDLCGAQIAHV